MLRLAVMWLRGLLKYSDCNNKSLIYLISSNVCGKEYVGSTTDRFDKIMLSLAKEQLREGRTVRKVSS